MSIASPALPVERRRKRVRKGTRSCWECKRRKIRCQLSSEIDRVCAGCLARGTTCISQEFPEEHDTFGGNQVGQRLARVEHLLEKLVAKANSMDYEQNTQNIHSPESMNGNDVLTPYSANVASNCDGNTPILSLFDIQVIGHGDDTHHSKTGMSSLQPSGTKTPSCRPSKTERIRQTLVDLLPSQHDIDIICEEGHGLMLLQALSPPHPDMVVSNDSSIPPPNFNLVEVSKLHPTLIARTILCLAVCLQQLPPSFDANLLQFTTSIDARVERYLSTVQTLITSDDELVCTMEGIQCLLLQGLFHFNGGSPRRGWLTFRRALNVGQLMGIHRPDNNIPLGTEMWHRICQSDRFLALLLGLPCGSMEDTFGPEETFKNPNINKDLLFSRKLCEISGRIAERNQSNLIQDYAYATTQDIDERLENLAKAMPQSWWGIPTCMINSTSAETALAFDRLYSQMWYFQLQALLHLPFMIRAATDDRFKYSKMSCLNASREMMHRYVALRTVSSKAYYCKVMDFEALTSTVTLLLGLLELPHANATPEMLLQKESDKTLVHSVLASMEELSTSRREVQQCVNVIKTLLSAESPLQLTGGNVRLRIPYFGTITITRPPPTSPQSHSRNFPVMQHQQIISTGQQTEAQTWQGLSLLSGNPINIPVVSFTSSQFPPPVPDQQIEDWALQEADTLFFDSLLDTDIEGNWIF